MYKLLSVSLCVFLAGCATVASVKQLPPGSTVAVISGLDDRINYEYVGSTEYMSSSFQYRVPSLHPDNNFISPMESSLARSGYHVMVKHVPANSPITNLANTMAPLSYSQMGYLHKILGGKRVDRVIIISKGRVNDLNHPEEHLSGYGYLMREGTIYAGTQVYGAVTVRVITMDNHHEFTTQLTYIGDQVANNKFAMSPLQVHPWSITYFKTWLKTKFAPNILASLHDKKILRN